MLTPRFDYMFTFVYDCVDHSSLCSTFGSILLISSRLFFGVYLYNFVCYCFCGATWEITKKLSELWDKICTSSVEICVENGKPGAANNHSKCDIHILYYWNPILELISLITSRKWLKSRSMAFHWNISWYLLHWLCVVQSENLTLHCLLS